MKQWGLDLTKIEGATKQLKKENELSAGGAEGVGWWIPVITYVVYSIKILGLFMNFVVDCGLRKSQASFAFVFVFLCLV